jgi:hypothetical protein
VSLRAARNVAAAHAAAQQATSGYG